MPWCITHYPQARNILTYLQIIHALLSDDGIWINLGPLLWHFENSPTTSSKGEGSIELSLDEVKELARRVGFDMHVRQSLDRARGAEVR